MAAPHGSGEFLSLADDATLALALIDKNRAAPQVAWTRFSPLVRRVLSRSLGPRYEVEDVVQNVFLCVFQRVHTLREPLALKAFVLAITVRAMRYEVRRARVRRWVGLSPSGELADLRVVNSDNSARQALIRFYRVLDRLGERDRAAFVLRFIEELEVGEVAAALNVSIPTARRSFSRAWERVTFFAQRDPFLVDYLSGVYSRRS